LGGGVNSAISVGRYRRIPDREVNGTVGRAGIGFESNSTSEIREMRPWVRAAREGKREERRRGLANKTKSLGLQQIE